MNKLKQLSENEFEWVDEPILKSESDIEYARLVKACDKATKHSKFKKYGYYAIGLTILSFLIFFNIEKETIQTIEDKEIPTDIQIIIDEDTVNNNEVIGYSDELIIEIPKKKIEIKSNKLTFNKGSKSDKQKYIDRFDDTAIAEMNKYGIPASISLAQGLLESNAGNSKLSTMSNNHFGIKCFSKKCKKGHCSNYTDDSHKDFFRNYDTAWESWRSHSKFLIGKRYAHLLKLKVTDYKGWAVGLKKAGYATDKNYHNKLIKVIEDYKLYKFDNYINQDYAGTY